MALIGCQLFPDVDDWIVDSERLARSFDKRLSDLEECVAEDSCDEAALDSERTVFVICSWVVSRGELGPEGDYEAAEWWRFDGLCEGLEGVLALPKAEALDRIEELRAKTDRISEGIRADIEPRERMDEAE